jgi:membrane protein YdbS with pleckstrin-like domain
VLGDLGQPLVGHPRPRTTWRRNGITSSVPPTAEGQQQNRVVAHGTHHCVAPRAYPCGVTVFSIWPDDIEWRRVSPRLIWIELLGLLTSLAFLAGVCAVAWYVFDEIWIWAIAGGLAVIMLVRLIFLRRSLRSWGYAERADDLLVRHGLMFRRLSIVPYGRMQFVDVTAGPVERLFGLATVQLHTAAAATDAKIPGLPPHEAARLRDRLAALGEARAEGRDRSGG